MAYDICDQHALYFITFTTVGHIDVFTRKRHRDIIIDSLKYCQRYKGLILNAYVVMSNHLHLICHSPDHDLSAILRDMKSFTAKKIITHIRDGKERRKRWLKFVMAYYARSHSRNHHYQLWEHYNHAVHLRSREMLYRRLTYIHNNPVKAGIVGKPEHYLYSSTRNYLGKSGLIDVAIIDIEPLIGYVDLLS